MLFIIEGAASVFMALTSVVNLILFRVQNRIIRSFDLVAVVFVSAFQTLIVKALGVSLDLWDFRDEIVAVEVYRVVGFGAF